MTLRRSFPAAILGAALFVLSGCHPVRPVKTPLPQVSLTRLTQKAAAPPLSRAWASDLLVREADYIVDCSFTENAVNHVGVSADADAYGALNDIRVFDRGPDWVMPGEAAQGAIGLMAASAQLKTLGQPTGRYDAVLDAFFDDWLAKQKQGWHLDPSEADYGGVASRLYYDKQGRWQRSDFPTSAATGILIGAMWKRAEYLRAMGRVQAAEAWLRAAWPLAEAGGEFLRRNYSPQTHMVRSNATSTDLWLTDSVLAVVGLRALARWSDAIRQGDSNAAQTLADNIGVGIGQMKDGGWWHCFYRLREQKRANAPGYGDSVDQICFLPYEADVLPATDPFAKQISDWWTFGTGAVVMTPSTKDPKDWRYYGTHWHHFFAAKPEENYLYPGPGLQLAKVEWKYGHAAGDQELMMRARHRLEWATQAQYSGLWLGATGQAEAGVPNGVVDWRDSGDRAHAAGQWVRFVDTSAYLIEATLMVCFDKDTRYVPESKDK